MCFDMQAPLHIAWAKKFLLSDRDTWCMIQHLNIEKNNYNVRFKGKVLLYKGWVNADVYKIWHMFDDGEKFQRSSRAYWELCSQTIHNATHNAVPAKYRLANQLT